MNNEWSMEAPKQKEQVPAAMYTAKFAGVAEHQLQLNGKEEIKWRFCWEILSGEHKGKLATSLTDRKINPNTLAGRLITGLLGKQIPIGENVKAAVEACVGKTYLISVQGGPQGGKPCVRDCGVPPAM